ncbi:MAG: HAMP domain-containing histidine kinase [Propionibacteriaceae bacterium]|jgi:two-component system sensor histidine kinase SenX3|nr:HAMP domain-containing histidine kinase [Propionibacteriaceae bacterium]
MLETLLVGIASVESVAIVGFLLWRWLRRRVRPVPADAIAALTAFGGFSLVTAPRSPAARHRLGAAADFVSGPAAGTVHSIVYASPLAARLPLGDGQNLTHPELAGLADEAWRSGQGITRPYSLDSLGSLQHVVAHAAPLGRRWVLVVLTDRTEEVRGQEVRRDFVANFGHELRTPVTAVSLIAQALAASGDDPAAVRHFARRLEGVAERLQRLTEDMSALSRIEKGGEAAQAGQVEIDAVVDRAIGRLLEASVRRKVKVKHKKRARVTVTGDRSALTTAVENLIANAIDYSPSGSRITVTARADPAEGEVVVSVIDQGIGIAAADQERVFERFYRTDEARSLRVSGTGLGLAIAKHTALAHGGRIAVTSRPGAGSTFSLVLPLRPAAAGPESPRLGEFASDGAESPLPVEASERESSSDA